MFKIPCRCGKSQKSFFRNIGPFFVNECCAEAGFDDLGNPRNNGGFTTPKIDPSISPNNIKGDYTVTPEGRKLGRGTLVNMNLSDLVDLAKRKGLSVPEKPTKKAVIEELVKDGKVS